MEMDMKDDTKLRRLDRLMADLETAQKYADSKRPVVLKGAKRHLALSKEGGQAIKDYHAAIRVLEDALKRLRKFAKKEA
jgi:hypothetical protein